MKIRHLIALFALYASTALALPTETYILTGPQGETATGQLGYIQVPENRLQQNSPAIRLGFVILPRQHQKTHTNSPRANPIVYLSGGPGGSATWTARGPRLPMFTALTEIADVIVFDQRGTGLSRNHLKDCSAQPDIAFDQPLTQARYLESMKRAAAWCADQWRDSGIDLQAYNTRESVEDLEALRKALGAEKIDLWGISYGTHLALAMAKKYPHSVGRMVLASTEGLDETIKLPSLSDAQLQRIADEISADATARQTYPDLLRLMRDTLATYRQNPATIEVKSPRTGEMVKLGVGAFDIQLMTAGYMAGDREGIAMLPRFFSLLHQRDFTQIGDKFLGMRASLWTLNPMSMAMDAASGISAERWQQVQREAQTSILGRAHNLPFPDVNAEVGVTDLGDSFRAAFSSDIPTLFFFGSLDGRTFMESHHTLAARFTQATVITVKRGGHNLFMSSPDILSTMKDFYQGKPVNEGVIELDAITFL